MTGFYANGEVENGAAVFLTDVPVTIPPVEQELVVSYRFIALTRDYNTKTIHFLA